MVVFASTNARFFCAGADLQRVANPTAADALHLASQRIFARLSAASVVSIAVVEGAAVAGGFECVWRHSSAAHTLAHPGYHHHSVTPSNQPMGRGVLGS